MAVARASPGTDSRSSAASRRPSHRATRRRSRAAARATSVPPARAAQPDSHHRGQSSSGAPRGATRSGRRREPPGRRQPGWCRARPVARGRARGRPRSRRAAASLSARGFSNETVSDAVCRSDETSLGSGGMRLASSRRNERRDSATSSPSSEPVTRQPLPEWPSLGSRHAARGPSTPVAPSSWRSATLPPASAGPWGSPDDRRIENGRQRFRQHTIAAAGSSDSAARFSSAAAKRRTALPLSHPRASAHRLGPRRVDAIATPLPLDDAFGRVRRPDARHCRQAACPPARSNDSPLTSSSFGRRSF